MLGFAVAIFGMVVTGAILLIAADTWAHVDETLAESTTVPDIDAPISNAVASSSADGHPATDAIDGNTTSFWES